MKSTILSALAGLFLSGLALSPAQAADKADRKDRDPEQAFKKHDKDNDGSLTLKEMTGKKGNDKVEARFKKLDKDNDGKVTLAELKAGTRKKKG